MNLTVSLKSPLTAKYGSDGFSKIDDALANYAREAGNESVLVYLDDPASMSRVWTKPVIATNAGGLAVGIRQIRQAIGMKPGEDSIFIIGGETIVPHWQFLNPVQDRTADRDPYVYTDNPYGTVKDELEDYLAPEMAVGRLTDAANGTGDDFANMINAVTNNHRMRVQRSGSAVVYNAQWQTDTENVAAQLESPLDEHSTPGYEVTSANRSDLNRKYLYFNLHGFADDSAWSGFNPVNGQFFPAVTPDSFDAAEISGTVVYAENCYGAWTVGKNSGNSCALKLLAQGAAGMVGATGLAFGSYISPGMLLQNADELAKEFFGRSVFGEATGKALVDARTTYLHEGAVPSDNVFKQKTLLQFTLLGDPTLA